MRDANLDAFGTLPDQINNFSNQMRAYPKSLEDLFILIDNVFRDEPDEVVLLSPSMEKISTWISPFNKGFSEAGNASQEDAGINNNTRPSALSFRQQR